MQVRLASLLYGFRLPLESIRLILRNPALLFWSILPIAITLTLYYWVIQALQIRIQNHVLVTLLHWGFSTDGGFAATVIVITKIILFILSALTFSIVATLASSPFNDRLAETTEKHALPPLPPVSGGGFRHHARLLWLDIAKALASGVMSLIAILISWVPVVNLIAFAAAFLLIAFQYTSYPQTRRGVSLGQGVVFLMKHSYACIGLGACLSLFFAIPVISALVMPLAVVSGTLLVARTHGTSRLH